MNSHTSSLGDIVFSSPDAFRGTNLGRSAPNNSDIAATSTTMSSSTADAETTFESQSLNGPQSSTDLSVSNSIQCCANHMVFDDHSDTEYDAYPRWTQVPYSPLPHVDELLEHLHEGFSDITSEAIIWKHFQRSDQKFVDLFTRIDPADWKISRSSAQFLLQLLYSQLGFTTDFDLLADWDDIEKWYDKYNTLCDLWNSPAMIPYSSRVSYLTVSMDVHWDECSGGIRDGRHHTAKFSMIRTGDRDKPFACTGEVVTCEDRTHAVCVCLLYNRLRDVLALETGLTITANDGAATSDEARYRRAPGYVLLECLEFIVDHCRDMVDRFILGGYLPYDTCGICGLAPIAEHLVLNHRY